MSNRAVWGWLSVLGVLAAFALGACSEDTEPKSDVPGTTVPAAVETTTTTITTTTTTASTTTTSTTTTTIPTAADFEVSIDDNTVWGDVLDNLAEADQECILEALGDEAEAVMDSAVLSGGGEEWIAPLLACLDPDTARELYFAIIVASVEEDFPASVGPQEEACLRERLSDEDLPAFAADPESPDAARLSGEMMNCIPSALLSMFMEEILGATGAAGLEFREEQVSCLQDAMAGIDWTMFIDSPEPEDPEAAADFLDGMVSCVPDVFVSLIISEMEVDTGKLSEEVRSCLRELVIDLDWSAILAGAEAEVLAEVVPGLIGCAPELLFLDDEAVPSDGDGGDADPVKGLSEAASEIADDLNEAAIDVGDSSLDDIADELTAAARRLARVDEQDYEDLDDLDEVTEPSWDVYDAVSRYMERAASVAEAASSEDRAGAALKATRRAASFVTDSSWHSDWNAFAVIWWDLDFEENARSYDDNDAERYFEATRAFLDAETAVYTAYAAYQVARAELAVATFGSDSALSRARDSLEDAEDALDDAEREWERASDDLDYFSDKIDWR